MTEQRLARFPPISCNRFTVSFDTMNWLVTTREHAILTRPCKRVESSKYPMLQHIVVQLIVFRSFRWTSHRHRNYSYATLNQSVNGSMAFVETMSLSNGASTCKQSIKSRVRDQSIIVRSSFVTWKTATSTIGFPQPQTTHQIPSDDTVGLLNSVRPVGLS